MSQITDRDCLRCQFHRCARILGEEPWTQRLADHERDRLRAGRRHPAPAGQSPA
jgi:hypothetical protein